MDEMQGIEDKMLGVYTSKWPTSISENNAAAYYFLDTFVSNLKFRYNNYLIDLVLNTLLIRLFCNRQSFSEHDQIPPSLLIVCTSSFF